MCRLICRYMLHYRCWTAAVAAGPLHERQEHVATCPNCRGRGHVISCWNYMDTAVTTQIHPISGMPLRNLLDEGPAPVTPRNPPRIPDAVAAQLLQTPEPNTAQRFRIGSPSSEWGTASHTDSRPHSSWTRRDLCVIPSTLSDANDWVVGQTGFGTEASDRRPACRW